jgi:threonine aldolase
MQLLHGIHCDGERLLEAVTKINIFVRDFLNLKDETPIGLSGKSFY